MNIEAHIYSGKVPEPIAKVLRRLIRRIRTVILIRGLAAVIATAAAGILLVMAIDASFTLFSQASRWVLTLLALAVTAGVGVWFLMLPLAKTMTLTDIARAIETRHPELQERLSSAVELLTSKDIPEVRGSEVLIQALAREASEDAVHVRPQAEVPLKRVRPFVLVAAGLVVILLALWAVFPSITGRLLARAVAPFMNLPNISADMLAVQPGDTVVPEGRRLEVQVTVANDAVKRCSLRRQMPDGTEQAQYMTALPDSPEGHPRFTMTLPPAAETFRYRVHAGDALTRFYDVRVIPPAVVRQIDAHYEYPAYTGRPAETKEAIPGDIKAVAGTRVAVTARLNKAVKQATLQVNGRDAKTPVTVEDGPDGAAVCRFEVHLKPRTRGRWALALTDAYDFSNTSDPHRLEALPDRPPTVEVLDPIDNRLRLKPSDRLPVDYAATDDYGLGKAEFVVVTDTRKHSRVDIPLPTPESAEMPEAARSAAGRATLPLRALPLEGVKEFTFRMRVADNRPKNLRGPGQDFSRTITVEIDRSAASYAMQRIEAEKEAIRKGLEKVVRELKKTKQDSVPLKKEAPKAEKDEGKVVERVERMREHLAEAEAEVGAMAAHAPESPFPGMAPKLDNLGQEVAAADSQTGQVKLADDAADRGQAAEMADRHVDKAKAIAEELLKDLDQMAEAATLAQALEDLAAQQGDLASQRAAQEANDQWQRAQEQLAGEIGDMVNEVPAARQAALEQDADAAADLASQARALQEQQSALAEESEQMADLDRVDEALRSLASEQSQLAREAKATPVAADQAPAMHQAAENIQQARLAQAVQQQKGAEQALAQRAKPQAGGEQACGEQAGGEQAGGEQAGGEQAGGEQAGGEQAGGEQAGGEQAGGEQAGGEQAGGEQAGGEQAGGEQAGGEQASGEQAGGEQAGGEQAGGEQAGGEQAGGEQSGGEQSGGEQSGAEQAGALAERQTDIRERTEQLLAERSQLAQQMADTQMARLQAEQAQLAREATQLAEESAPAGQAAAQAGEQAAHDAQAAADQLPRDVGAAAETAESAAQGLGELAQALSQQPGGEQAGGEQAGGEQAGGEQAGGEQAGGEQAGGEQAGGEQAGGQPSSDQMAQMADQASGLAERQADLAAEMKALAEQSAAAALEAAQENLAGQTEALQEAVQTLGQHTQGTMPETSDGFAQADQALQNAQAAQAQAQESLAGQTPSSASGPQQSAASSLGQAAEALGQLGQALAQAAEGMPTPSPSEAAVGQPLAEGSASASEAAATQSSAAAAQAAQSLAQAASQAAAMAQGMGAQPGQGMARQPGQAEGLQANSEFGTGVRRASMTAAQLEALGLKLSDWARLPGELRNEILQAASEGAPREYRALIKRYFRKVAAKGSHTEPTE